MRSKFKWIFTLLVALTMQFSFAQEKTVTGVVSDDLGPVAGASVVVKGTTNGTTTDFDGNFAISAKEGDVLEVSYVGNKQEVKVGAQNTYNVSLVASQLEEVVVVAYGTAKKETLTGSVSELKTEEVAKITTGNVTQGLVGKLAGVQVANGNGMPGEGASIRIRGISSLSASSNPLYVVDGVPFYGNINSLNTQDIESMTVLKDASAAALYGSRGASGVIIITTKKGKIGKSKVTFDSKFGFKSRAVKDYDFITDQKGYYQSYWQALKNRNIYQGQDGITASNNASADLINGSQGLAYNAYDVANGALIDPTTGQLNPNASLMYDEDWSDYLFGDGFYTQNILSISGANENTTHYFSAGYDKDEGYVVNSGFEKFTSRLKLDTKVTDWFKAGGNIGYSHTKQDYLDGYTGGSTYSSPFYWVRAVAPIYPVMAYGFDNMPLYNSSGEHMFDDGTGFPEYDANGDFIPGTHTGPVRPFGSLQHPYATAINDYKRRTYDNVFATGYFDVKLFDGLTFTYTATGELYSYLNRSMDTQLYGDAVRAGGRVSSTASRQLSFTQQQLLKYNKRFGDHGFDVLAGHETLDRNYQYTYAERSKLLFDSPNVDHAALNQSNGGGSEAYSLESFFGRVVYDYDNKYIINGSVRTDGSSRFHKDNRWGTFYGLGVAWRVSQESFMENVSWLDELKLKGSFGQQGNDGLLDADLNSMAFPYLTPYSVVYTTDSSLPISIGATSYKGNPDVTWETTSNYSAGFDASLFNRRLNIEAEYFIKDVSDMLYNRPLAPSSGFSYTPENIGDMENKGIEVTLNGDVIRKDNLVVSLDFNATSYKNKIKKLVPNGRENNYQVYDGRYIREEGGSAYDFYLKEFAGVNPANGAAMFWKNVDDNDPSAGRELTENWSEGDLYRIGKSALPDVFGGFGASVMYKQFDFGINFAYQFGGYSFDSVWLNGMSLSPGGGLHSDYYNTWTSTNVNAGLPRVEVDDPQNYYSGSSLALIKSDYVSIQDITLGYTFDSKIVDRIGLSKLRIYGLADNVHLWSKRKGYDPRQGGITGSSSNNYSLLRTVSFGLSVEF